MVISRIFSIQNKQLRTQLDQVLVIIGPKDTWSMVRNTGKKLKSVSGNKLKNVIVYKGSSFCILSEVELVQVLDATS